MNSFDELLVKIGSLGWFQIRLYMLVCLVSFGGSLVTFAQVFIGGTNDHWCKVDHWGNDNCSQFEITTEKQCSELTRNLSTVMSVVLEAKDLDSHCVKYNLTGIKLTSAFKNHHLLKYLDVIPCDQGWNFDRSVYRSTITEDVSSNNCLNINTLIY